MAFSFNVGRQAIPGFGGFHGTALNHAAVRPVIVVLVHPSVVAAGLASQFLNTPSSRQAHRTLERQSAFSRQHSDAAASALRGVLASLLLEALLQQLGQNPAPAGPWSYPAGHVPEHHAEQQSRSGFQKEAAPDAASAPTVQSLEKDLSSLQARAEPAKAQALNAHGQRFCHLARTLQAQQQQAQSAGLPYTPAAGQLDELNKAFRKLCLHLHPDKWANQPELKEQAGELFKTFSTVRDALNP